MSAAALRSMGGGSTRAAAESGAKAAAVERLLEKEGATAEGAAISLAWHQDLGLEEILRLQWSEVGEDALHLKERTVPKRVLRGIGHAPILLWRVYHSKRLALEPVQLARIAIAAALAAAVAGRILLKHSCSDSFHRTVGAAAAPTSLFHSDRFSVCLYSMRKAAFPTVETFHSPA
jgi:hypothetical protein